MITKIDAIISLVPNAEVCVRGDVVEWLKPPGITPTDEQITAELTRLQTLDDIAEQKETADLLAAKTYAKLTVLKTMSPAEIQSWMTANVTTLAQARDALITLAIAVSILARRL